MRLFDSEEFVGELIFTEGIAFLWDERVEGRSREKKVSEWVLARPLITL